MTPRQVPAACCPCSIKCYGKARLVAAYDWLRAEAKTSNPPAAVMSHCCVFAPLHLALTTVFPLLESQHVAGDLPTMPMAAAPGTTVVAGAASRDRRAPRTGPPAFHGFACGPTCMGFTWLGGEGRGGRGQGARSRSAC